MHYTYYISSTIEFNSNYIMLFFQSIASTIGTRNMSTNANPPLTSKEKFKKAIKEYGSTVIVFHVGISLMSLGGCYLLVSRYVLLISKVE